jgi:hypothetical protein
VRRRFSIADERSSADYLVMRSALVRDLIKVTRFPSHSSLCDLIGIARQNFVSTRSVTAESSAVAVQHLYRDFLGCTSADPTVRLVLLLSVFASSPFSMSATVAHVKLQTLKLTPLTHEDLMNMLLNPFVENFSVIGSYATVFMGYSCTDVKDLLTGAAVDCLPLSSKVPSRTTAARSTLGSGALTPPCIAYRETC